MKPLAAGAGVGIWERSVRRSRTRVTRGYGHERTISPRRSSEALRTMESRARMTWAERSAGARRCRPGSVKEPSLGLRACSRTVRIEPTSFGSRSSVRLLDGRGTVSLKYRIRVARSRVRIILIAAGGSPSDSCTFAVRWSQQDGEELARPAGLEPATIRLEGGCSIQLSYGRSGSAHSPDCADAKPRYCAAS